MISSKCLDVTHLSQAVRYMCIVNTTCGFDTKMKNDKHYIFFCIKTSGNFRKEMEFFAHVNTV